MSEFQASNFKKENGGTPDLLGKTELTSSYFFVPPSGTTEERPQNCAPGTIRFNTDVGTLEVYRGDGIGWEYIQRREDQYLGGGTGSNTGTGTRALIIGGYDADSSSGQERTNIIDHITLSTLGNAQDFGDMVVGASSAGACGSRTRFIKAGGFMQGNFLGDHIEFNTFASTGNAIDFGNLIEANEATSGVSDGVRGVFMGGGNPSPNGGNRIQYIQIATTGDAVDFGDLQVARHYADCISDSHGGLA